MQCSSSSPAGPNRERRRVQRDSGLTGRKAVQPLPGLEQSIFHAFSVLAAAPSESVLTVQLAAAVTRLAHAERDAERSTDWMRSVPPGAATSCQWRLVSPWSWGSRSMRASLRAHS